MKIKRKKTKGKPLIAIYGIYKNEENAIIRFLESVQLADEVVFCDTGSNDNTKKIIEKFMNNNPNINLRIVPIYVFPWRFDDARNTSLSLVSPEIDICISLDIDEYLMDDWKTHLINEWEEDITRYYHKFKTYWADGNKIEHWHERIHSRKGYSWVLPVHEILEYNGEEKIKRLENFWIYQKPEEKETRQSYLPLLEQAVIERKRVWKSWSFNSDGTPGVTFWYEKIHKRQDFRWIHPVHEVLQYYGKEPNVYAKEEKIQLNHYPDPSKSRGQYLPLLEKSVNEDPDDDRNMHYLGREYLYYGMWDKSIKTLRKHLEMPKARWQDERSASMRFIARAYRAKNDLRECENWLLRAIAEAPYLREAYIEMAKIGYINKDWSKVYCMVEEALKIKERPSTYINEAFAWDYTIYDLGAISCYWLGFYDKSLEFAKIAVEMSPTDERLIANMKLIENKINQT